MNLKQVICLFFLILQLDAQGQGQEKGYPFVTNYAPTEYHAGNMNYQVARDSLGVFYCANEDGVLLFDGNKWGLIPIKSNQPVYWVTIGHDGVVYVSSSSEFGYLKSSNGHLEYVSLLDKIDAKYHDFEVVWEISSTSREVLFRSRKYLFIKTGEDISVLETKTAGFDVAYAVRDTVYVRERGVGLCKIVERKSILIPGGDYYADFKLNIHLPYGKNKMLIGSRSKGLFLYDKGSSVPFKTDADSIFLKHNIYHGCLTQNGNFALAASSAGVAILDSLGRMLEFLDSKVGLPDHQLLSVEASDQNNLWLGTGMGISKVAINAPLTYFDNRSGLKDNVTDLIRYNGGLYVSTLYGLYKLETSDFGAGQFKQVNRESLEEISSLDIANDRMVVGTQRGLFSYDEAGFERIIEKAKETREMKISEDELRVYASIGEGHFGVYYKDGEDYQFVTLEGFIEPIKKILEFGNHIVLVTGYGNLHIIEIVYKDEGLSLEKRHSFNLKNFNAIKYHHQLMVFTPKEAFFMSMDGQVSFRKKLTFSDKIKRIEEVSYSQDDHIWVCFENDQRINYCEQLYLKNGVIGSCNYKFKTDFRVNSILAEEAGVSWFGGAGGVLRFDSKKVTAKDQLDFACYISEISLGDSVLFNNVQPQSEFEIDSKNVELKFSSFTNQSSDIGEMLYQYRLEGLDSEWSAWTTSTSKNYTHLHHGEFRFAVRAKNTSNQISEIAFFEFTVMAPYYQTVYAYLVYLMLFVLLVYCFIIWRLHSVRKRNRKLEWMVDLRTIEVENQKEVLKQSSRTKDQLFSIIGHDLRSPLNSLESLAELIQHYQNDLNPEKVRELMSGMTGYVRSLRGLLDNLLSWTLSKSGNLRLVPALIDIWPFCEAVVAVLMDTAKHKNIAINLSVEEDASYYGDENSLSVILRNLVSNAIKFTNVGGEINVMVKTRIAGLEFSVEDNGIGIEKAQLNSIFDLSQTSYGTSNEKGTGLGLALVKDFVELNKGTIEVTSEVEKGTKFMVFLPQSTE